MEHKIATLEVYVSDRDNGISSRLDGDDAAGKYKIVLNPNFYGQGPGWEEKKHPWHSFAHELGHFLARVGKRNSHNPVFRMLYGEVPAELEAWRIAHEEIPMPNPSPVEEAAMEQYRQSEGL